MCTSTAYGCTGYVLGFMGKQDAFDHLAFNKYYNSLGYCGRAFKAEQTAQALETITTLTVPYHLYGFSQGASSVAEILKKVNTLPEYTLTIGGYKTTDVNFNKYSIKFDNYFDYSGIGQKSPGVFLKVPHLQMQSAVNKLKNIN